ncbi:MAG: toprim domain-containing protein [Thiobacillaceae bacterium]
MPIFEGPTRTEERGHHPAQLPRFMREIPLPAFLANRGYVASWLSPNRYLMTGHDEVLVLARKGDIWLYYDQNHPRNKGTIVNWMQGHGDANLGRIRQELRSWLAPERRDALMRAQQAMDQTFKREQAAELDRFVHEIPLPQFLKERGYEFDRRESGRNSFKFRDGKNILIVSQKDGAWRYFNALDDSDHGTVIQFVQNHGMAMGLGDARRFLRPYVGAQRSAWRLAALEATGTAKPTPSTGDVAAAWGALAPLGGDGMAYLLSRGLVANTLRTYGRAIRLETINGHQNIAFVHVQHDAATSSFIVSGWERKGPGRDGRSFSGFNGRKGLAGFMHPQRNPDRPLDRATVCESSIDALSKAQMDGAHPQDAYLSLGGGYGKETEIALQAFFLKHQPKAVILGLDADQAGQRQAQALNALLGRNGAKPHPDFDVTVAIPVLGKDWNEMLQSRNANKGMER